ncbi:Hypothetical predicted protein, partial [Paramuricea clavata]
LNSIQVPDFRENQMNNEHVNEILNNKNSSLLNNMQVPDPRENQIENIDLTAKPKERINTMGNENKVLNPQPNNENSNSGKNRPLIQ